MSMSDLISTKEYARILKESQKYDLISVEEYLKERKEEQIYTL